MALDHGDALRLLPVESGMEAAVAVQELKELGPHLRRSRPAGEQDVRRIRILLAQLVEEAQGVEERAAVALLPIPERPPLHLGRAEALRPGSVLLEQGPQLLPALQRLPHPAAAAAGALEALARERGVEAVALQELEQAEAQPVRLPAPLFEPVAHPARLALDVAAHPGPQVALDALGEAVQLGPQSAAGSQGGAHAVRQAPLVRIGMEGERAPHPAGQRALEHPAAGGE